MSTLAVFLVVAGGTALAATNLPSGSVTSSAVKNNSLTSADLKNGRGVTGADIVNGTIKRADLGSSAEFPLMEVGEKSVTVAPGASASVAVECPIENEEEDHPKVIAGGAFFENESGSLSVSKEELSRDPGGWRAAGTNNGKTPQKLTAEAICVLL